MASHWCQRQSRMQSVCACGSERRTVATMIAGIRAAKRPASTSPCPLQRLVELATLQMLVYCRLAIASTGPLDTSVGPSSAATTSCACLPALNACCAHERGSPLAQHLGDCLVCMICSERGCTIGRCCRLRVYARKQSNLPARVLGMSTGTTCRRELWQAQRVSSSRHETLSTMILEVHPPCMQLAPRLVNAHGHAAEMQFEAGCTHVSEKPLTASTAGGDSAPPCRGRAPAASVRGRPC